MALQTIAANAGLHSVVISVSLMSQLRAAGSEQAKLVVTGRRHAMLRAGRCHLTPGRRHV